MPVIYGLSKHIKQQTAIEILKSRETMRDNLGYFVEVVKIIAQIVNRAIISMEISQGNKFRDA